MQIRRIRETDREKYIEMSTAFYSTDAVMHTVPVSYFEATLKELMRSDTFARCYIIEHGGKTVGYCLTARTFSQEAGGLVIFLEELYIEEAYRSMGLGSQCLEFVMCDEPEARRFRLEVEEANPRAKALYERLGFSYLEYLQMYKEVPVR